MSFLLHDSLSEIESADLTPSSHVSEVRTSTSASSRVTIIKEKFRLPAVGTIVSRNRLLDLLDRSNRAVRATLVSDEPRQENDISSRVRNKAEEGLVVHNRTC